MLTTRVIPCLDVEDGRVVKGTQFKRIRDAGDPAELAAMYNSQGDEHKTGYLFHDIDHCFSVAVGRADIQENDLIRPLTVIHRRQFRGISSIADPFELRAFDHSAILNVQAGDHTDRQHRSSQFFKSINPLSPLFSGWNWTPKTRPLPAIEV